MPRQDSFLHLLLKLGIADTHPDLAERLATEDIIIPNMPCAILVAEALHDTYESAKSKPLTGFPSDGTTAPVDEPPEPKWPPVPRPSIFRNPIGYFRARHKDRLLQLYQPLPPGIEQNFQGLTDPEKAVAWDTFAVAASIAGPGNHEELDRWLADVSRREHIVKPRLIITDCDFPKAAAQIVPGEIPSLFVSTNLIEILPERQLRALMAHELGHIKERKTLYYHDIQTLLDCIRRKSPYWQEEFRADAFAARVTGSPEDVADALITTAERNRQIKRFARQVTAVCEEYGFDVSRYFLVDLQAYAKTKSNYFPQPTEEGRGRPQAKNTHPSHVERMDAVFENETPPDKSPRGR